MQYRGLTLSTLNSIFPDNLELYLKLSGWQFHETINNFSVYYNPLNKSMEILVPLNKNYIDYPNRIGDAVLQLSIVEKRKVYDIINDIFATPADIIRVSWGGEETKKGTIPLNYGVGLFQSLRRTLYVAALDIIDPKKYYKKERKSDAETFIKSCQLGQTERGSFVVNYICPITNIKPKIQQTFDVITLPNYIDDFLITGPLSDELREILLSQKMRLSQNAYIYLINGKKYIVEKNIIYDFRLENDHIKVFITNIDFMHNSFTRKVTTKLISSANVLIESIKNGNIDEIIQREENDDLFISSNFCSAFAEMSPPHQNINFNLNVRWGIIGPLRPSIKSNIAIDKEEFQIIKNIADELKPKSEPEEMEIIGKVTKLHREISEEIGEISIRFDYKGELIQAKCKLIKENYEQAIIAHKNHKYIYVKGTIHWGTRIHEIKDLTQFNVI